MANLYQYQPLKGDSTQIRILHLVQNVGEETFRCTLETADVETAKYIALSYAWGDLDHSLHINVQDTDGQDLGIIPLTNNLKGALQGLRDSHHVTEATFWIDQISINQNDDEEKGHQVALMAQIYSQASQVITYTGPSEPDDTKAIALLERIYDHYSPIFEEIMASSQNDSFRRVPKNLALRLDANSSDWKGLCSILSGSWTTRLWMIQENVLNKTTDMLRGLTIIPGEKIRFLFVLWLFDAIPTDGLKEKAVSSQMTLAELRNRRYGESLLNMDCNLAELIFYFNWLGHRDPRDQIYALLGIAEDAHIVQITPNYTIPVEEVFLDAAIRMMQNSEASALILLEMFNPLDERNSKLPSWVPSFSDWSLNSDVLSGDVASHLKPKCLWDGSVLEVSGLYVTTIVEWLNSPELYLRGLYRRGDRAEIKAYDNVIRQVRKRLGESKANSILYRTLGGYISPDTPDRDALCAKAFQVAMKIIGARASKRKAMRARAQNIFFRNLSKVKKISERSTIEEVAMSLIKGSKDWGRNLLFTEDGRLCLGPPDAGPGDMVVAFFGGSNLYILRKKEEEKFIYVGDAYLDGIMKGELFADGSWEEKVKGFKLV